MESLIGQKFGRLIVKKRSGSRKNRKVWDCLCECGVHTFVTTSALTTGNTKSCGCIKRDSPNKMKDLTGLKFGLLLVLSRLKSDKCGRMYWLCRCDCGNFKEVQTTYLTGGETKSCGCLKLRVGKENPTYTGYEDIPGSYINQIKRNASNRNLEFNLPLDYLWNLFVRQNQKCKLSGVSISFARDSKTASLDRINSSKGYIKGNVQWVHKDVNNMKMSLNQEILLKYCKLIYWNQRKRNKHS